MVSANIGVGPLNITGNKGNAVVASNAFGDGDDGAASLRERLQTLGALLAEGVITREEHSAARRSALGIAA